MRVNPWHAAVLIVGLIATGPGSTRVGAQTVDELKQRIEQLERSTREQIETLKRMIHEQEAQRAQERHASEEREKTFQLLKEQLDEQRFALRSQEDRVGRFLDGWENFFDLQAGALQKNNDPNPLGKDIRGNVYAGEKFKIQLEGSLRLHLQHNDTPVGESVASALFPDTSVPGGGNAGGRENFRAFAGRTRLKLSIAGYEMLAGKTEGVFEIDFNRQFSSGESGAINNNPRLRHAFGRWRFKDILAKDDEIVITMGQTSSFADNAASSIDFNTLLTGLGAALRRNPRIEVVDKHPIAEGIKFLTSIGFERPFFGNDFIGTDLGPGDLSGYPAVSGGIGLETARLGRDFGVDKAKIYVRTTYGEFEERFNKGTLVSNFGSELNFTEKRFTNQAVHGTIIFDKIGFKKNEKERALTLQLEGGGVWSRGDALHLNAEFGRRVFLDTDGKLKPAQSAGGWINPMFYLTDDLSIRWAGGTQFALNSGRPVITGTAVSGTNPNAFYKVNNRQSEISIWWAPGPFTFALGYNHTKTNFKRVNPAGGSESRENENNKIEFISWFSF